MGRSPLPPERDGLFRAVRQGLPVLALGALGGLTLHQPAFTGWYLLGAVMVLAEVLPSFRRGPAFLLNRRGQVRRDGLWVRAFRPIFRFLGQEEVWARAYCAWNNERVGQAFAAHRASRVLVLLPHCIQLASCRADVVTRLDACASCGRCVVDDVLEATLSQHWDVRLTNRSHKAYREARAFQPDLIVAVSCTDRLVKGLLKLPEIPSYVIPLALPHGMCVDTTFSVSHLLVAMDALVQPRSQATIAPLRRDHAAS